MSENATPTEMGISDARQNLTEVASQVRLLGEHVTLTRRDKPQAVIVPMEWYERARAALRQQAGGDG